MASCGVARIDGLLGVAVAPPLARGDADRDAVGLIQDLLACHGHNIMPGPLSAQRGRFGPSTAQCVTAFQESCGLPATGAVDRRTLRRLIEFPAVSPVASHGYLALVLGVRYDGMARLMTLTSRFEGAGRFGAINRNTDGAGLSFGLIQWAQKPGRLNELLRAFRAADRRHFARVFGGGKARLADRLVRHTAQPRGGTDGAGRTTDPQFDLVDEPWIGRFGAAALDRRLQRVQVDAAIAAFDRSLARLRGYATAFRSERAIAFMLDLANQHGDEGARAIHDAALGRIAFPGESDAMLAIEKESVRRVRAQFGDGAQVESTQARRAGFRTSALLSDGPFHA